MSNKVQKSQTQSRRMIPVLRGKGIAAYCTRGTISILGYVGRTMLLSKELLVGKSHLTDGQAIDLVVKKLIEYMKADGTLNDHPDLLAILKRIDDAEKALAELDMQDHVNMEKHEKSRFFFERGVI